MKEFDERLQSAFDSVHAEEDLKNSARAYVRQAGKKGSRHRFQCGFRSAAAFACMLVVFCSGYLFRMYFEPVSVISIDINPSIELGINSFDRVICVEAFNEDGRELVDAVPVRFLNYQEAVDRIVTSQTVTELLAQKEELIIAVVGEDESRNAALCSSLDSFADSAGASRCYSASLQSVEHAHSCGMSYGKYLAYLEALEQDASLTPEEVQDMTMKEIREHTEETCHTEPPQEETQSAHHSHKHKENHH